MKLIGLDNGLGVVVGRGGVGGGREGRDLSGMMTRFLV